MTLSMELRSLLTELIYDLEKDETLFTSEALDAYMPKINKLLKDYIKSTKPIEGRTDAQVAVDRWEKRLLEELT